MLESNQENMWNTLKYIKVQEEICMPIRSTTDLHDQQQYEMSTRAEESVFSHFFYKAGSSELKKEQERIVRIVG